MSDQGRMQTLFRSGVTSLGRATGWHQVFRTAGDIRALGRSLLDAREADTCTGEARFDVQTIAAQRGLPTAEVERRLVVRQRETKWASRVYAGGILLTLAVALVMPTPHGLGLLSPVWLGGIGLMLSLGFVYNTLLNWQLRVHRTVSVGELFRHPSEWWAN